MAASGMAMMLKSLGLDPDELKANVEAFMLHMKAQAEKINQNQARLEAMLATVEDQGTTALSRLEDLQAMVLIVAAGESQGTTTAILENGRASGNLITSEKFPQEMIEDVMTAGIPSASNFDAVPIGGEHGGERRRSSNEE
jgi:hypothetical protein